ncbi:glycerol-3-phosphate responsive antiterminator [Rubrobacter aplysinae]|uniref:glycerol-3-phosphate responsive antiterminator n=1 Tax=Rubrobacter aplysinae TaxID=909625 RepID=UPI00064C2D9F|nr:glycerol-3-phosphate responsive antiterminator [Rubrobacter aplysinae]
MGKVTGGRAEAFLQGVRYNPVLPAVRSQDESFEAAISSDHHAAVFVLGGDIFELVHRLEGADSRPPVCVNVDLVSGVAADASGVRFLARHVEGIISTNRNIIELANAESMVTIQRIFAIDAGAIERGLKVVNRAAPTLVEILPALAYPQMAAQHHELYSRPVLAGGLIQDMDEVTYILESGAAGVSTSNQGLWRDA